jgi:hypothetical protein
MIFARLLTPIVPNEIRIGPVEYLKIVGKFLQLPDGSEIAVHQGGMWTARGSLYVSLVFDSAVALEFSHTELPLKERFGPYPEMRIVDGSIWPGEPPHLLARFDDILSGWHIYAKPASLMNVLVISRTK